MPLTILLLTPHSADLPAHIQAIAPGARLITQAEVEADPARWAEAEVIFGWVPRERWTEARRLAWVQVSSAGVDSLLTPEARGHPAIITNVHIHPAPISEHLFGLLLMLTRNLDLVYRAQREARWDAACGAGIRTLDGATLGVLGLGAIGQRVARIARAFGMRVIGLRRTGAPVAGVDRVYTPDALHDFLADGDVVTNLLPLTEATRGLLGPAEFAAMKHGALFLNAGRGATVRTDALVEALASGHLGGAGLDVTDPEPLPPDHPLWRLPRVLITPHLAGSMPDYRERAEAVFLDNLRRCIHGEPLREVVDKTTGY